MQKGIISPREPSIDLVRIISEGTYTSFSQALKEFISNAYDADATKVDININEDADTIIIVDNGTGMTLSDFKEYFASVARSGKAGAKTIYGRTKLGRLKIGRFGIGALAVAGISKKLSIRSTKKYSKEGFESSINLEKLKDHYFKGHDLSKHWVFNYEQWENEPTSLHFTEIKIEGINDEIKQLILRPGEKEIEDNYENISQLSGVNELIWQLGIICQVSYQYIYPVKKENHINKKDTIIEKKSRQLLKNNFNVFVNGQKVTRRILLPNYSAKELYKSEFGQLNTRGKGFDLKYIKSKKGSSIHFEGYVVVQAKKLYPEELRGVLIRIRGVGIGWHRTFNITNKILSTMAPNLSGEIWVDDFEDVLQFDRESFREDNPKYKLLHSSIINALSEEEKKFRERSASRSKQNSKKPSVKDTPIKKPTDESESFLPLSIFENMPFYVINIVPQINGCFNYNYFEACSVMIRRLIQTLIIEMYNRRNWLTELMDENTHDLFGLKKMINKICGDPRFGLDRKIQDGLKKMKDIGDLGAHEYRVKLRKGDLSALRDELRYTSERLVFKIKEY